MPQGNIFIPYTSFGGSQLPVRVDQQSSSWVTSRHGKFYAPAYGTPAKGSVAATSGALFTASNASSATLSAALATTYTGFCLSNPAASGKNLSLKRFSAGFAPSSAATQVGLITGWVAAGVVTHTTPITGILSNYVGAAASSGSIVGPTAVGLADAACTIVGTPLWSGFFFGIATTTTATSAFDLDDLFIIPPGGYVAIGGTAGSTGFWGSMTWEELAP